MIYRKEIDGLRAIAVIPVILFHAGVESFSGGFVGVDVFFVISGYLITTILLEEMAEGKFSFVHFYERRARRILPVLFVVVFFTLLFSCFFLFPHQLISAGNSAISVVIFLSNIFFWSERGYFGEAAELKPLLHTWSLAVEEQFYIVFPIVLWLLSRFKKTFLIFFLSATFLISLAASYYVTLIHFDTAFFFPVTRAWELLVGVFCALAIQNCKESLGTVSSEILSLMGMALILGSYIGFDQKTLFPYVWALLPTAGTALLILSARETVFVKAVLSWQPIVWVGLLSYSLYLWHQPVLALARAANIYENNVSILILLVFVLSVVSYFFVEKPFRKKFSQKAVWGFSALGAIIIVSFGLLIKAENGFYQRYELRDQLILNQFSSYSGYNQRRFDELQFAPFDHQASKKVILVGDSYAKDFLNVVVESNLFEDYSFSTRQINSECGNLYLDDYEVIASKIPDARKERCAVMGRYEGDRFRALVAEADEIWLAASWSDWVVDLLPLSVEKLRNEFKKPVVVIGKKNFGAIDLKKALSIPGSERSAYTQKANSKTADYLDRRMSGYGNYYPILQGMCGGDEDKCKIFTDRGELISTDGGHLTKAGAIEVGRRIRSQLLDLRG